MACVEGRTKRVQGLIASAMCIWLVIFAPNSHARSGNPIAYPGVVVALKGILMVQTKNSRELQRAKVGTKVLPGMLLVTSKGSSAKIVMLDENTFDVSEDSQVVIENYDVTKQGISVRVLVQVLSGRLRSAVSQKYKGNGKEFRVKTPSAVSGVRGTDFVVTYDRNNDKSYVVAFEGEVQLGRSTDKAGNIKSPVRIDRGSWSLLRGDDQKAKPVQRLSFDQLAALHQKTSIKANKAQMRAELYGLNQSFKKVVANMPRNAKLYDWKAMNERRPASTKPMKLSPKKLSPKKPRTVSKAKAPKRLPQKVVKKKKLPKEDVLTTRSLQQDVRRLKRGRPIQTVEMPVARLKSDRKTTPPANSGRRSPASNIRRGDPGGQRNWW
jgi:hypothetical protein